MSSSQTIIKIFTANICEKMSIQYRYGDQIRTHDLQHMSVLP